MTYRASSRQFGYSDASATRFTADIRSEGLEPSLLDTKVTQRNDTSFTPVDLPSGIFPSEDNPHLLDHLSSPFHSLSHIYIIHASITIMVLYFSHFAS